MCVPDAGLFRYIKKYNIFSDCIERYLCRKVWHNLDIKMSQFPSHFVYYNLRADFDNSGPVNSFSVKLLFRERRGFFEGGIGYEKNI